jgi:hypothetical protein
MGLFQNREAAEIKAAETVRGRDYKTPAGRKSAETQIANRKEREFDDWTRKNVGLD